LSACFVCLSLLVADRIVTNLRKIVQETWTSPAGVVFDRRAAVVAAFFVVARCSSDVGRCHCDQEAQVKMKPPFDH